MKPNLHLNLTKYSLKPTRQEAGKVVAALPFRQDVRLLFSDKIRLFAGQIFVSKFQAKCSPTN